MDIALNFINQSNDQNNSQIVIFQKNVATDLQEVAVAWKVIKNCSSGSSHPFKYPTTTLASAKDRFANTSDLHLAENGDKWKVVPTSTGPVMQKSSEHAASNDQFEISNGLPGGTIDAEVFKDGRLLMTKTGVEPQQKAVFKLNPTLWIGVASDIEEGDIMNSAIISDVNTELSLLGITKANIIMTGGGNVPLTFTLQPTE